MGLNGIVEQQQQIKSILSPVHTISGTILNTLNLQGSLTKEQQLTVQIQKINGEIKGSLTQVYTISSSLNKIETLTGTISISDTPTDIQYYTGEYIVTPTAQQTILYTKNRQLYDNITVKEIPYYQTYNSSGGSTVIIG